MTAKSDATSRISNARSSPCSRRVLTRRHRCAPEPDPANQPAADHKLHATKRYDVVHTWTGAHVDRGAVCSHHAAQPRPDLTSPSPTPRTPVASTAWGRSHRRLAALGLCVAFRQKRAFKTPQIVRNCLSTNLVGPNFLAYQLIAFARIFSFLNSGIDLSDFRLHRFRHRALTPCHHVVLVGLLVSCSLLRFLRRHAPSVLRGTATECVNARIS